MRLLEISTKGGNSKVIVGEAITQLEKYINNKKAVIVIDKNIFPVIKGLLPKAEFIQIDADEKNKTLETVEMLYNKFLELELDRNSFVVGIGGGIVLDVTGFAASTYLRGINFGFAPSTLLAQADASIGGKNGVNFKGYKNLIGTINQPSFVLCDFELLKTLPKNELRCGLAEIVKAAIIGDAALFSYIEENTERILSLHRTALEKAVYDSLLVKSRIVAADEKEKNERRKLNLGHTIGHAIEKNSDISHGEAVSIGIILASRISQELGLLSAKDSQRIESLLKRIGLPTSLSETKLKKETLMDAIRKDKKRDSDIINFVLIEAIGKTSISGINLGELEKCLK